MQAGELDELRLSCPLAMSIMLALTAAGVQAAYLSARVGSQPHLVSRRASQPAMLLDPHAAATMLLAYDAADAAKDAASDPAQLAAAAAAADAAQDPGWFD